MCKIEKIKRKCEQQDCVHLHIVIVTVRTSGTKEHWAQPRIIDTIPKKLHLILEILQVKGLFQNKEQAFSSLCILLKSGAGF